VVKSGGVRAAIVTMLIAMSLMAGCSRTPATLRSGLEANPGPVTSAGATATADAPTATVAGTGTVAPAEPKIGSAAPKSGGGKKASSAKKPASPRQGKKRKTSQGAPTASIVVNFVNGTSSKPLENTLIEVGRATFSPDAQRRSTRGVLSPVPVAETVAFAVYPDGRSGNRVVVPLTIAADDGLGESENVVYIVVSDESVQVRGAMPSGPQTRTYPRF